MNPITPRRPPPGTAQPRSGLLTVRACGTCQCASGTAGPAARAAPPRCSSGRGRGPLRRRTRADRRHPGRDHHLAPADRPRRPRAAAGTVTMTIIFRGERFARGSHVPEAGRASSPAPDYGSRANGCQDRSSSLRSGRSILTTANARLQRTGTYRTTPRSTPQPHERPLTARSSSQHGARPTTSRAWPTTRPPRITATAFKAPPFLQLIRQRRKGGRNDRQENVKCQPRQI